MKIDAVHQRTRQPRLIIFGAAWRPAAGQFGEVTAAARVHRGDQLEPGWVGDVALGTGDADATSLNRLAQRFECRPVELRQLVEEQDALVGEGDFARPGTRPAADERRQRGGMVGIAERSLARQLTAAQPARDRLDHAELERLGGFERRQDPGKPRRQHRLARSRRPDHQQIVAPGSGDLESALGAFLALHVPKVEPGGPRGGEARVWRRQELEFP